MKPMTASPDTIAPAQRRRPTNGFVFWTGRVLLGLLALLVGLAALGASYQAVATAIDQRSYPAPGQLVDVGGEQMHINCVGEATAGSPTVILEHGLGGASPAWGWIQPQVARTTRVCAYDRAGMGWNTPGSSLHPRDGQQVAQELHALLQAVVTCHGWAVVHHRLAYGTVGDFLTGLWSTPGCQVLNAAFIERLNATFQAGLAPLVRRTRALARLPETLTHGMLVVGACYNFCTLHTSLTTVDGMRRTPAMAAGITDHWWSMSELLRYRMPPARWEPPKRPGRRSHQLQALIDRWAPTIKHICTLGKLALCQA